MAAVDHPAVLVADDRHEHAEPLDICSQRWP
jgi:hypothetical protein